ncbi:MAG: hypothetical protein A4E57_00348 [Syntrophorhabdaceae bacterium PtaU1.Bin034]|nr:MAG: hypothetical protein A4E57_00348 [Syntrophorhabdaceae bacterium PtaU1.Bin034]
MNRQSAAHRVPYDDNEEFLTPLLGLDDESVKTIGVIRPGIKILKKDCTEADRAKYEQLLALGMSWTDMEKELGDKLVPDNVDYFTVNSYDCINPTNADLVKKLYADADGRLRSIPVYFAMNEWWNLIPHRLYCYGRTRGLKHRSSFEYEREGGRIVDYRMVCETPVDLQPGKKLFGGRGWVTKPCDPESCPEYQKEECKLSGRIYFMIPGIKGMGSWVIPTKSYYSMKRVKKALRDMYQLTNGRIAYLLHKGEPVFMLRKVKATVPSIDWKKGETTMRQQCLIDLDVVVDPLEVAREYSVEKMLEKGRKAFTVLTAGTGDPDTYPGTYDGTSGTDLSSDEEEQPAGTVAPGPMGDTEAPAGQEPCPRPTATRPERQSAPETPKNGNGRREMDRDQKAAITKMASRYRVPAGTLDKVLAGLESYDEAAKVISELNKGDISRFLPARSV